MTSPPQSSSVWDDHLLANPHAAADKRQRVQRMFAAIAPTYDLNNRLHSLWMDQRWRARAVELARPRPTDRIVDVACGTGDLTLALAAGLEQAREAAPAPAAPAPVLGIDFTFAMLPIARRKTQQRRPRGRASSAGAPGEQVDVRYLNGDAMALPLPDGCCDVVSIAFGIRNVADPAAAIREFRRVLRAGGRLIILEFSLPSNRVLRALYNVYFRRILPITATWISRDRTGAYRYLPESVNTFIDRGTMMRMMADAGFSQVTQHPMTFGVCVGYRGVVG